MAVFEYISAACLRLCQNRAAAIKAGLDGTLEMEHIASFGFEWAKLGELPAENNLKKASLNSRCISYLSLLPSFYLSSTWKVFDEAITLA